jgi:hypothetical protein
MERVGRRGEMRNAYDILVTRLKGRDFREVDVNRIIILKWIIKQQDVSVCIGLISVRTESTGGLL